MVPAQQRAPDSGTDCTSNWAILLFPQHPGPWVTSAYPSCGVLHSGNQSVPWPWSVSSSLRVQVCWQFHKGRLPEKREWASKGIFTPNDARVKLIHHKATPVFRLQTDNSSSRCKLKTHVPFWYQSREADDPDLRTGIWTQLSFQCLQKQDPELPWVLQS